MDVCLKTDCVVIQMSKTKSTCLYFIIKFLSELLFKIDKDTAFVHPVNRAWGKAGALPPPE